jgi:Glycosyl hydrolase family 12
MAANKSTYVFIGIVAILLGLAAIMLGSFGANASTVSHGHEVPTTQSEICGNGQWKYVDNKQLVLDNQVFGPGSHECITNSNDGNNFTVKSFSGPFDWDAYPTLFQGYWFGIHTVGTPLPAVVHNVTSATQTLGTRYKALGGNSADDFWFNKDGVSPGQPNGDELMIWFNERDTNELNGGSYVHLDGQLWHLREAHKSNGVTSWNYTQFIKMKRVGVEAKSNYQRNLNVLSFVHYAERKGYIHGNWTWQSAPEGYEVTRWEDLNIKVK